MDNGGFEAKPVPDHTRSCKKGRAHGKEAGAKSLWIARSTMKSALQRRVEFLIQFELGIGIF